MGELSVPIIPLLMPWGQYEKLAVSLIQLLLAQALYGVITCTGYTTARGFGTM